MGKRAAAGAALVLLIGSGWFFFLRPDRTVANYPSSGTNIVAFGDSLVEGEGATSGNDLVSDLSRLTGEPIVNLGKSGDTTAEALARLPGALAEDPKVVILLVGGNDYLRRVPREETQANLEQMIRAIEEHGSIVLLLGVRGGLLSDGFRSMYDSLAARFHTAYVPDVLDGIIGNADLLADEVHPNNAGYLHIADRVAPVLQGLLP